MKSPATLQDVCREARVSKATVSRVLNDSPAVRSSTRQRVEQAIRSLGYSPNASARALAGRRKELFGVLLPGIGDGFFAEFLEGMHQALARIGWGLLVGLPEQTQGNPQFSKTLANAGRVDALVFANMQMTTPEPIRRLAGRGLPVVMLGCPETQEGFYHISVDNQRGAAMGLQHLIQQGARRIAVLLGPDDCYEARLRWQGCQQAASQAGLSLDPEYCWQGGFSESLAGQVVEQWIEQKRPFPDAIYCCNDAMAIGTMLAFRRHGISVPGDLAMAGFDNIDAARLVGLTTIAWPARDAGRLAVEMALAAIESRPTPRSHIFEPSLVVRESCGAIRST
jgi:DNA-binding LacI/PurR family transcriptional regulator